MQRTILSQRHEKTGLFGNKKMYIFTRLLKAVNFKLNKC